MSGQILLRIICSALLVYSSIKGSAQTTFEILNGKNVSKCSKDTLLLKATTGAGINSYNWNIVGDPTSLGSGSSLKVVDVSPFGEFYIASAKDAGGIPLSDTIFMYSFPSPTVNLGPDQVICAGNSVTLKDGAISGGSYTFKWNNGATLPSITVNTPGTYWLTITGPFPNPCGATDTIKVIGNAGPTISAGNDTLIAAGSSANLKVTVTSGFSPYTYAWLPGTGLNNSTLGTPTATPTVTTTYTVIVTDSKGCKQSATVKVRVSPKLIAGLSFTDTTACRSGAIQLKGNVSGGTPFSSPTAPYQYSWTPTTGLTGANTLTPTASPLSTTLYTLTVKDSIGIITTASVKVNVSGLAVTVSPRPTVGICSHQTVQLNALASGGLPGYAYQWAPANLVNNPNIANPIAVPTALGTTRFIVTVTDKRNCTASDSVIITVNSLPIVAVVPRSDSMCVGETLTLRATASGGSGLGYQFSWSPTSNLNLADPASPVFTATTTSIGPRKYYVTVSDNRNCVSLRDSITITTLALPEIRLGGPDTSACQGTPVVLNASYSGNAGFDFVWIKQETGVLVSKLPVCAVATPGTYQVKITNPATGCMNTGIKKVVFQLPPSFATIVSDSVAANDEDLSLSADSDGNGLTYQWSSTGTGTFSDPTGNYTSYTPTPADTGVIHFKLTVKNGCGHADTTRQVAFFTANRNRIVYVPAFFSPSSSNPDNQALKVFGTNISSQHFIFRVFNRWGEQIYQTSDFTEANQVGWNGLYKGGLNSGTSTYLLKGEFTDGTPFEKAGTSTLTR